jgi:hypothetical protein
MDALWEQEEIERREEAKDEIDIIVNKSQY